MVYVMDWFSLMDNELLFVHQSHTAVNIIIISRQQDQMLSPMVYFSVNIHKCKQFFFSLGYFTFLFLRNVLFIWLDCYYWLTNETDSCCFRSNNQALPFHPLSFNKFQWSQCCSVNLDVSIVHFLKTTWWFLRSWRSSPADSGLSH